MGEAGELDADEAMRLYEHYAVDRTAGRDAYVSQARRETGYSVDRRAEEDGKVRLGKYVTTEHETITEPVETERVVVERGPADGSRSPRAEIGEEIAEVASTRTRSMPRKDVVDKETVTGPQGAAGIRRPHASGAGRWP